MQILDIKRNPPKQPSPKKPQKQTNNIPQNAELLSFTADLCKNNIDLCAQAFT